jgi:3-deoxy-7-phosphoheptulonate synthase
LRELPPGSLVYRQTTAPITVGSVEVGTGAPVFIAGPCSVESREHVLEVARNVKAAGAKMLRGGAFKPRTSPYDFQGLGREGLEYLREASNLTGLPVVSEVMSAAHIELAEPFVDVFQIGARNMHNFELLKEVGKTRRPVLLKRGFAATIKEFLNAAEYILLGGNSDVILCERGIRTFETYTRNTLDLSAVAALKTMTNLPVIVDPSHGTGRAELVRPLSRAAIACGADGLLVEVHERACEAISDGSQAITSATLREIISDAHKIHSALAGHQLLESRDDAFAHASDSGHAKVGSAR